MYMRKRRGPSTELCGTPQKYQDNQKYYHLLRHTVSAQRDMKKTNQVQFLLCHSGPFF